MADVFLSHNSKEAERVQILDRYFRDAGISTWLDTEQVKPGDIALEKIQHGLNSCHTCLIIIGPTDLGRYHRHELWVAINNRVADNQNRFRVIPVLLPGATEENWLNLPNWLRIYSRVQLESMTDQSGLELLTQTIRGDDMVRAVLELTRVEENFNVRFYIEDQPPLEGPFLFDCTEGTPEYLAIKRLEKGELERLSNIGEIGAPLWASLFFGPMELAWRKNAWNKYCHLRLLLPPELEWLPWETLYDEVKGQYLLESGMFSIIRDLPSEQQKRQKQTILDNALRVLIVMPGGSGLDERAEIRQIEGALNKLGNAVTVTLLDKNVTLRRIEEYLVKHKPHVFHFLGHGRMHPDHGSQIRLNQPDEWVDSDHFAILFARRSVRLVIVNCCFGGSSLPSHKGLGQHLLARGVPAVIAMQYQISDQAAVEFAAHFYRFLVSNPNPGRIDHALERTRRKLLLQNNTSRFHAFVTPRLYLARGAEELFRIRHLYQPPRVTDPIPETPKISIDPLLVKGLLSTLVEGRCVPVIGPDLLPGLEVRDAQTETIPPEAPGPRGLAAVLNKKLAGPTAEEYPDWMADNSLCDRAGSWFQATLLQRVCQYYEQILGRRRVIGAIQAVFETYRKPPNLYLDIASWDISGLFVTWFDGMMEMALGDKELNIVGIDDPIVRRPGDFLLINLRGSWSRGKNLIITELDERRLLWNRFHRMSNQIEAWLAEKKNPSLLFLGCSPKDELTLRLAFRLLINSDIAYKLGDVYFVCRNYSTVDQAFWKQLEVNCVWIEEDPAKLIPWLTRQIGNHHE